MEQQQKSVLQTNKKDKEKEISFESIKDLSINEKEVEFPKVKEINIDDVLIEKQDASVTLEEKEDVVLFKNKVDIEKELFEEFNNNTESKEEINNNIEEIGESEKKLPNVSIDEYMKNFDENKIKKDDINSLFDDDELFPSIPL